MRANSLALRLFVWATGCTVIILIVTGIALSTLYRHAVERAFDRRLDVYLRTLVADVASPEEGGEKAYRLLTEAMQQAGYAGIAKVSMHNRENIVIIRARDGGLTLHTMFYSNEIRSAEYGNSAKAEIKDQERTLARQLIENLAAGFEPEKYSDTYQDSLRSLVDAKMAGREVTAVQHHAVAPVIDLMAALKKSLEKKPPVPSRKQPQLFESQKKEAAAAGPRAVKSRRKVG